MRPFTLDGKGQAINLFNIRKEHCIPNASTKSQCSKDYMYGKEPKLEQSFRELETLYANIRDRLIDMNFKLSLEDITILLHFIILQYSRTEAAANRLLEVSKQHKEDFDIKEAEKTEFQTLMISLKAYLKSIKTIDELKLCILHNTTKSKFILSDDPAVMVSRFQNQRQYSTAFGLNAAGIEIYLPISPDICLLCFDKHVYHIPKLAGQKLEINQGRDIDAINQLQYARSSNNIYFSEWEDHKRIVKQFHKYKRLRRDSWASFMYFKEVKEGSTQEFTGYVRINSPEDVDQKGGDTSMTASMIHQVAPSQWVSFLKYKLKPRYFENGSAAGAIRISVAKEKFNT